MWKLVALFVITSAAAMQQAQAVPILEFRSVNQTVVQGAQAVVDVYVRDLESELIGAYDLTVVWDANLLALDSVAFDVFLDSPFSLQSTAAGAGSLNAAEVSLDLLSNQIGLTEFRLFSLTFDAIGAGTAALWFAPGGLLSDAWGLSLDFLTNGSQLTITGPPQGLPEPGTLSLLSAALMLFAFSVMAAGERARH